MPLEEVQARAARGNDAWCPVGSGLPIRHEEGDGGTLLRRGKSQSLKSS